MKESIIFTERNLTEKVHYVYRVTIDDKYYIGKRSGLLNDLATGRYKTSSNLVHEKLQNGVTFSKIKILKIFSSSKDALEFERRILTRVNANTNPKFLNQSNGNKDFCLKQHSEKSKKKMSEIKIEYFNPETEEGRKRRENLSKGYSKLWDENTESGRKRRKDLSEKTKERFNPETQEGSQRREDISEKMKEANDINTESGIKRRKHQSNKMKEYFNPETESGRKNLEKAKVFRQKGAETQIQNRKDDSFLGELMFDEAFIRQNFLITDDKNNPRFLSPIYSKLTGYSISHICVQKRNGKLRFLYGIKSIIKITEEFENSKIEEIKAIIKSRNEKDKSI